MSPSWGKGEKGEEKKFLHYWFIIGKEDINKKAHRGFLFSRPGGKENKEGQKHLFPKQPQAGKGGGAASGAFNFLQLPYQKGKKKRRANVFPSFNPERKKGLSNSIFNLERGREGSKKGGGGVLIWLLFARKKGQTSSTADD